MLNSLTAILGTHAEEKAAGLVGVGLACLTLLPPLLLFGCKYLTKDCPRSAEQQELVRQARDGVARLKME